MATTLHHVEILRRDGATLELRMTRALPTERFWVDRSFVAMALGLEGASRPDASIDAADFRRACDVWSASGPGAIASIDAVRESPDAARYALRASDDALFAFLAAGLRFGSTAYTTSPDAAYLGDDGAVIVPPPGIECAEAMRIESIEGARIVIAAFAAMELPLAIPALWLGARASVLPAISRDLPASFDPFARAARYVRALRPIEVAVGAYCGMLRASAEHVARGEPDRAGAISIARYEIELADEKWAAGASAGAIVPIRSGVRDVASLPAESPSPAGEAETLAELIELSGSRDDLADVLRDGLRGGRASARAALGALAARGSGLDGVLSDAGRWLVAEGPRFVAALRGVGTPAALAWLCILASRDVEQDADGVAARAAGAIAEWPDAPDWAIRSREAYAARLAAAPPPKKKRR